MSEQGNQSAQRWVEPLLRVGGALVSLWGAVVLAIAGAFLTPFRVGAMLVPVSVLLAVAGNAVLVWFARRTTGHKFLTVAPGLVWLGVTFLVQGSVRRAGSRLRVTSQLIDAATCAHLWAGRHDGAFEDVFDLQDQVTARVVAAVAPRLSGDAVRSRIAPGPGERLRPLQEEGLPAA